jgi:mannitol-1-phosphate 5-dehydrogenase
MKKAVMYGAGNIGRGFIGQLFSESGYEVVFIDVNTKVVDKLNTDKSYPILFASQKGNYEVAINHVRAVNGTDLEAVAEEISEADIMATAVGVNILPRLAAPIAKGLDRRWKKRNWNPLNIIICENLIDANHFLRKIIKEELVEEEREHVDELVGFVEASIGRMVPVGTPQMQEGNILRVCVEEYGELPVDKDGFKGDIPKIKNMIPFSPFEYYIQRKLFIHNLGHATAAYLGFLKGCKYIWEAIGDGDIRSISRAAMMESARALSKEHQIELKSIEHHVDDLINRFGNKQLGDTVERVGRDLQRKLSPNDRLVGAFNLCVKNGVRPENICIGLAAALQFEEPSAWSRLPATDEKENEEALAKAYQLLSRKA